MARSSKQCCKTPRCAVLTSKIRRRSPHIFSSCIDAAHVCPPACLLICHLVSQQNEMRVEREKGKRKKAILLRQEQELGHKESQLAAAQRELSTLGHSKVRHGTALTSLVPHPQLQWLQQSPLVMYTHLFAGVHTRVAARHCPAQLCCGIVKPGVVLYTCVCDVLQENLTQEVSTLKADNGELRAKLEESKQQLQSNEQMIRWLNQQVGGI